MIHPHESETLARLAAYIAAIQAAPCTIGRRYVFAVGRARFPTVEYRQTCETPPGTIAYARGERSYVRECAYTIGERPSCIVQRKADALALPCGTVLWIAAYLPAATANRFTYEMVPNPLHYRHASGIVPPCVHYTMDPHPGRLDGLPLRVQTVRIEA